MTTHIDGPADAAQTAVVELQQALEQAHKLVERTRRLLTGIVADEGGEGPPSAGEIYDPPPADDAPEKGGPAA